MDKKATVPYYEKKTDTISCTFCNELEENPHLHPEVEFIFCIEGKAGVLDMGNRYEISKGQAVFISPNQLHYYKNIQDNSKFGIFCFSPEIVYSYRKKFVSSNSQNPIFNFERYPVIKTLICELIDNYEQGDRASSALLTGFLNVLMYWIHDDLQFVEIEKGEAGLVNKILNYCLVNYRDRISVQTIAEELNTNSNNISHIFNENMQIGIPQYVNFLRVSEACRLLETTDYSISKISEDVGFGSFRNLNRLFMSILGTTPSDYRKTHQS